MPTPSPHVDPVHGLVEIRLTGLWAPETFTEFAKRARSQAAKLPVYVRPLGPHITLVDLLDFAVRQATIVDLLTALAAGVTPRWRAVQTHSASPRWQIRRIIPDRAFFTNRAMASAWLLQHEPDTAPA